MLCRELQSTVHWREGIRLQGQLIPSNHSRLHVPGWRLHQPQRHRRQEHLRRKVCGRELPTEAHWIWLVFCSVLYPSSIQGLGTPWTYFFYLSLSCVILTDSSTGSPVHVLMLSIQAVRGRPRLRAPGIVPCIISFSRQLPCFLMV